MPRGGAENSTGVRKRHRANSMGLQWWRKLTLPRRGKKDSLLAPAPLTEIQRQRLADRRAALQKAVFAPRAARLKHLAKAEWDSIKHLARVVRVRGNSMHTMGIFEDGIQYLYPEEALFLVDKGALSLSVEGLPTSLQRAWALCMASPNATTLEEYLAFAHLRRAGYVVRRYEPAEESQFNLLKLSFSAWRASVFTRKEPSRPLFHVSVFRYEQSLPLLSDAVQYLDASEKSRLKLAVIDRGVVVITDAATNATPLSERFVRRLSAAEQSIARGVRNGRVEDLIQDESGVNGFDSTVLKVKSGPVFDEMV